MNYITSSSNIVSKMCQATKDGDFFDFILVKMAVINLISIIKDKAI